MIIESMGLIFNKVNLNGTVMLTGEGANVLGAIGREKGWRRDRE